MTIAIYHRAFMVVVMLGLAGCESPPSPSNLCIADRAAPSSDTIDVRVTKDGSISFGGEQVPHGGLEARLRATDPANADFLIKPDSDAPYAVVAHVMAALQRTGHSKCGVIGYT